MSNESPEVIEREMASTRQSLTDKVAALEDQVAGTLHSATSTVQDTIHSLKAAVTDTVETVKGTVGSVAESVKGTVGSVTDNVQHAVHSAAEGVKDTFNVSHHVRKHPWAAVGSSAAAGFLTGLLCFRKAAKRESVPAPVFVPFRTSDPTVPATPAPAPRRPGLFDDLLKRLTDEVGKVAETAIKTLSESVTRNVHDGIPKMVDGAVAKVADTLHGVGAGAGGHGSRIRESDWE